MNPRCGDASRVKVFKSHLGHIISPRRAVFGQLFLASEAEFPLSQALARSGQTEPPPTTSRVLVE
jgi:hypothetical protein